MIEQKPVALVTGGAKRVGRAIVKALAEAGIDVAFTYWGSGEKAQSLVAELSDKGLKALSIRADLTNLPTAARHIEQEFRKSFDRLNVLVNNASLYLPADLASVDLAATRRMWAIHCEAPMLLCQQFAADLRKARGSVINMVDLMAERPWPQYLAYCASKAALANLTLGLAREFAPLVRVNGIAPGVVEWPENDSPEHREAYLKRVPLGRAGTPEEVAATVVFLGQGATYVTGQIIRLDGGRSIT